MDGTLRPISRFWSNARRSLSWAAARRAARLEMGRPRTAERWLRLACRLAPRFDFVHRDLCAHFRRLNDRLAAVAVAEDAVRRFDETVEAWVLLGECYVAAYRSRDAIAAYERALMFEERADAAMAAGDMYAREGDHATAGARYARAYAAGAGPRALRANAEALRAAGDLTAAAEARRLWEQVAGKRWEGE
ncbi:MAG: hypothetical protein HY560_13030 [Gemmatimonadetes bacterium]|nr:hypothetical protein [Gemmatimonadota bacterium]